MMNNPFYDNHIFKEEEINRAMFNRWNWIWLWLYPTFVQVNEGYAFHYKIVNGAYYVTKVEPLTPELLT